ncbi:hypothetical protein ABXT08_16925 [Chryseobacterium sp. NRRL B-14859]|uniref:hypothetical protein n=1 Tax=unclassified Chryseobacterium TaxID=2593645 RepID=UPI000F453CC5|nr:hypothetical protein [Chryseobacterium sp. G0240]ROI05541.1 hypothetical protein EGI16_03920 [Chryseobacterium sp. G0240]
MKKYLFMTILLSFSAYSQIGVNTSTPTKSLDVNGELRVRTLPTQVAPNISKLLTSDTIGNILAATPLDAMYSSGLITKGHMVWNNILVGAKSARLDFTGRIALSATDFTFSVFYDVGAGFTILPVSSPSSVTIAVNGPLSIRITNGGTNYILTFTEPNNGFTNVSCNIDWIQGTFFSIPNLN